jgi:4-aminobutyrate aminotransferase-like enzyme
MGDGAPLFYDEPIQLVRGEGVWLFDADGTRYLDCYNNVPCVGHANERVVAAMHAQAATLNVHSRYLHENVVRYAERVTALHHGGLESMIVACTGSEANEIALAIARESTGGAGIVCTDATYHGNTPEVAKLTQRPVDRPVPGVRSIRTPQLFRRAEPDLSDAEICDRSIADLEAQIAAFEADGSGFAGAIFCPLLANEGLVTPPTGFFERMVDVVRRAGGLVIADEVQAGFARSGSWWGYEVAGFQPDIAVLGKPMGNGLPLAATLASHDLVSAFRERHRYFNTFAASPLQAAAGDAVIAEIESRSLVATVAQVGAAVRSELLQLQADRPAMGDVRGHGLFIGVDWVHPGSTDPDPDGAAGVVEALRRRNVLLSRAGEHRNVLKIRPPLVFGREHADVLLEAFADATQDCDE